VFALAVKQPDNAQVFSGSVGNVPASTSTPTLAPDQSGPVVTSISVSPSEVNPGETVTVTVTAEDQTGFGLANVQFTNPGGGSSFFSCTPSASSGVCSATGVAGYGDLQGVGTYVYLRMSLMDSLGNDSSGYTGNVSGFTYDVDDSGPQITLAHVSPSTGPIGTILEAWMITEDLAEVTQIRYVYQKPDGSQLTPCKFDSTQSSSPLSHISEIDIVH